ncbi:MAG: bifunctional 3,4-dihydroxy-2-butanone-4-phosphate synthase/GTP cyclohydrolase II [Candidatus Marinimicrobia bacterium]|nr:bifunctional 3,4-dihydroxy-2-butanone-4-phosphate synthase/GTP cyclohydrolase II [Candidatus Neomarinimicrobiota bacterium]
MTEQEQSGPAAADEAVVAALAAIRAGRLVVVLDDIQRENEGDLICAAGAVTPELINFMATHGRGLICVGLTAERLAELGFARMSAHGRGDPYGTAFMESVDARGGVTTGISAYDRAHTIRLLAEEGARAADFIRPGHVFPLQAVAGGVLRRPGHTEAAVDLARLAGLAPAGVICEILREDGQMAREPELRAFAARDGLPLISIAELTAYRRRHEKLVHRETTVRLPTPQGEFTLHLYHSDIDQQQHLALVMGAPEKQASALVRIHSECLTGDVFGSRRCDCGAQLQAAMARVAAEGHGVVLYMRQEGRGIGLAHKIKAYALQDEGLDTVEANIHLGFDADLRDYGSGAQILADLGLRRLRLLTNNPRKVEGLERYGLEIVERVSLMIPHCEHNQRYLNTKRDKLGHLI